MSQEYEHRIVIIPKEKLETVTKGISDPSQVKEIIRAAKKALEQNGGGVVDWQQRPLGPWETVEKIDV